jgi:hypothetical protein
MVAVPWPSALGAPADQLEQIDCGDDFLEPPSRKIAQAVDPGPRITLAASRTVAAQQIAVRAAEINPPR